MRRTRLLLASIALLGLVLVIQLATTPMPSTALQVDAVSSRKSIEASVALVLFTTPSALVQHLETLEMRAKRSLISKWDLHVSLTGGPKPRELEWPWGNLTLDYRDRREHILSLLRRTLEHSGASFVLISSRIPSLDSIEFAVSALTRLPVFGLSLRPALSLSTNVSWRLSQDLRLEGTVFPLASLQRMWQSSRCLSDPGGTSLAHSYSKALSGTGNVVLFPNIRGFSVEKSSKISYASRAAERALADLSSWTNWTVLDSSGKTWDSLLHLRLSSLMEDSKQAFKDSLALLSNDMCLIDYLHPESSTSFQASLASEERFLLFHPQGGLTNQMMALQDAMVYASVLNRTLVIPPIISNNSFGALTEPSLLMDLQQLNQFVRSISYKEFPNESSFRLLSGIESNRFISGMSTFKFFEEYGIKPQAIVTIPTTSLSREAILSRYGACQDHVLAFSSLFGLSMWRNEKETQFLFKVPQWNAIHQDFVDKVASSLGPFSCLHLRRGDFKEYCEFIEAMRAAKGKNHYKSRYFSKFSMSNCFPSLEEVSTSMARAHVVSKNQILYIATNEKNSSELARTFGPYFSWMTHDLLPLLQDVDFDLLPMYEQMLCERSSVFIGNHWSSFSQWIKKRRGQQRSGYSIGFGRLSP